MTSGRRRTSERSIGSGTPPSTRPFAPRRVAVLLFAALLAAFAAGIWGTVLRPSAYEVRGTIVARAGPAMIFVPHEPAAPLARGAVGVMALPRASALLIPLTPKPVDHRRFTVSR